MPILLDTNILMQLARRSDEKVLSLVNPKQQEAYISIVTVGEIRSIAVRNTWGKSKLGFLENFLLQHVVIDINYAQLLDNYVELDVYSQLKHPSLEAPFKTPRNMGKNDLWIAATAMTFGMELVTTDDDFDHLNPVFVTVRKLSPVSFIGL
jgi:tRNA(fMet)-specific endonuclease VapC